MTVSELIEKLKTYSSDTLVLVDGYEGGYSEISSVKEIKVKLNVNSESYNGPHDDTSDADTDVIVIRRS